MLDQASPSSQPDLSQKDHSAALSAGASNDQKKPCSSAILVWLKYNGDASTFVSALEASNGVENFHFVDAQRTQNDPSIWRCRFEETKPAPNLDRRSSALLKRLSLIGTRVRAERVFQRAAASLEGADDYQWDGYTRRPLS
ncbi:MAG: hypothetical protein KTR21_15730 [Rhodobacteraceae bacterium]|nr:hypothetical protein [Paracoccaceae bacterium]